MNKILKHFFRDIYIYIYTYVHIETHKSIQENIGKQRLKMIKHEKAKYIYIMKIDVKYQIITTMVYKDYIQLVINRCKDIRERRETHRNIKKYKERQTK